MEKVVLKRAASFLLVAVMMVSTVVALSASPLGDVAHRYVDGEAYVPIRYTAYVHGYAVEWDQDNQAVIITDGQGNVRIVSVEGSGGFNDNGTVYIPVNYAMRLFADTQHGLMSLGFVEYMSTNLPYRAPFTYNEKEAAIWIAEQLSAMGFDENYIEIQEFTYDDVSWFNPFDFGWELAEQWAYESDLALRDNRMSQNVILTIPGQSESTIIVGAHYDSYLSAGANDNASGVALLLESAYHMQHADNYHTIVYVFFGAEEVGLWGARYFYDTLTQQERDNIVMMINADGLVGGPYLMYSAAMGAGPGLDAHPFVVEAIVEDANAQIEAMLEQLGFETLLAALELDGLGIESAEQLIEILVAQNSNVPPLAVFAMWEAIPTAATAQIDAVVDALNAQNNFTLLSIPEGIVVPTDQIVFLLEGHTVLYLAGLARVPDVAQSNMEFLLAQENELFGHFIHTPYDTFAYIEAFSPGMMEANLRAFSLMLEQILLERFN
ncbi:MAG: M20/M25/M40 family metallo-hydrolase [Defluviitaleaceae bacterium]|nr:M20/M25/M40 family metallo-hydrolase [Defluviitaleaceae bacterium]